MRRGIILIYATVDFLGKRNIIGLIFFRKMSRSIIPHFSSWVPRTKLRFGACLFFGGKTAVPLFLESIKISLRMEQWCPWAKKIWSKATTTGNQGSGLTLGIDQLINPSGYIVYVLGWHLLITSTKKTRKRIKILYLLPLLMLQQHTKPKSSKS